MKVKIIYDEYVDRFEDKINDFIKDKHVYDIKFPYGRTMHRAMIMYDEPFVVKGVVAVEDVTKVLLSKEE